jgi:RNA-directed DNA polymerase
MTKTSIGLQELRRRIYVKAKAEPSWRFWGLYVHVCKQETLRESYRLAKTNNGAPGIDGVTFDAIEGRGVEAFLGELRTELISGQYRPVRNRKVEIPKDGGKIRVLGIPTIRDRVVQGCLKLILEPIFESDFQDGSYGYRPKRTAHQAVARVSEAVLMGLTRVVDLDLKNYFDTVSHSIIMGQVAKRVNDAQVMRLLKLILKANGKRGVPQGGVISPLLSNLYLNEVDKMLERAREVTRRGKYLNVEYARFADDLVVLISGHPSCDWLARTVPRRLREELAKLEVQINEEKTKLVDLMLDETFSFVGFDFREVKTHRGKSGVRVTPRVKSRTRLLSKLREVFRRHRSHPINGLIVEINPIVRGWVSYFRIGQSGRCFTYVRNWIERKVRRAMMRARKRPGFGWNRWSSSWLYETLCLFDGYGLRRSPRMKALPAR